MDELKGMKVAILITDGFEQVEMVQPRQALKNAGAETNIVSPKDHCVCSWNFVESGEEFPVDIALDRANEGDFRRVAVAGWRYESQCAAHECAGSGIREGFLQCRQACGSDLPRSLDRYRGRCSARATDCVLAFIED
jgi:DJ-1/PfpI family protein